MKFFPIVLAAADTNDAGAILVVVVLGISVVVVLVVALAVLNPIVPDDIAIVVIARELTLPCVG